MSKQIQKKRKSDQSSESFKSNMSKHIQKKRKSDQSSESFKSTIKEEEEEDKKRADFQRLRKVSEESSGDDSTGYVDPDLQSQSADSSVESPIDEMSDNSSTPTGSDEKDNKSSGSGSAQSKKITLSDNKRKKSMKSETKSFEPMRWKRRFNKKWSIDKDDRETWDKNYYFVFAYLSAVQNLHTFFAVTQLASDPERKPFIIAYFTCFVFMGYPLAVLEMSIGQFSGWCISKCWAFAPVFKGLGYAITVIMFYDFTQIIVVNSWLLQYIWLAVVQHSFTTCDNKWNTRFCLEDFVEKDECTGRLRKQLDGTCRKANNTPIVNVYNYSLVIQNNISFSFPSQEYFRLYFLRKYSTPNDDSVINVEMVLSLAVYMLILLALLWGRINTFGVVIMLVSVINKFLLVLILAHGYSLGGIGHILNSGKNNTSNAPKKPPPASAGLSNPELWLKNTKLTLQSMTLANGRLVFISSYNPFKTDVFGYSLVVFIVDFISRCAFIVFFLMYLGYITKVTSPLQTKHIIDTWEGLDFIFALFPIAVGNDDKRNALTSVYYIWIFTIQLTSQLIQIRATVRSITEIFPGWKFVYRTTLIVICLLYFLIGLSMCSERGVVIINFIGTSITEFHIMAIVTCEVVAVSYVYGVHRFIHDVGFMVGHHVFFDTVKWRHTRPVLAVLWLVIPVWLIAMLVVQIITGERTSTQLKALKGFDHGIITFVFLYGTIFLTMAVLVYKAKGTLREKIMCVMQPSTDVTGQSEWRPIRESDCKHYNNTLTWRDMCTSLKSYFTTLPWGDMWTKLKSCFCRTKVRGGLKGRRVAGPVPLGFGKTPSKPLDTKRVEKTPISPISNRPSPKQALRFEISPLAKVTQD